MMIPDRMRWKTMAVLAAVLALAAVARLPYLRQDNLSPDAADYLTIARNIARGQGLTGSIKWHFFTDDPAVHSAIGERPVLYPLLLAPFCGGDDPARAGQSVTTLLALLAAVLGVAWARQLGVTWRAAVVAAGVLAFNPGLLMCSVFCWTEPLYLVWLFAILLVVGKEARSAKRAWLAALLTVLAYLTRPSAPAIAMAMCVWYARRRAFAPLGHYLLALFLFLVPWWAAVWATRGNPFYSMQAYHLCVLSIEEGMAAGYGVDFPHPAAFVLANGSMILAQILDRVFRYLVQILSAAYLSVLSGFLFLRLFRHAEGEAGGDGPWFALAAFHFLLPALTWATFDPNRFMLSSFAVLLIPAVGEMDRLVGHLGRRRARAAVWISLLGVLALLYFDQWMQQLYQRIR